MAKFLFLYRGGNDDLAKMTPVEMQQQMQRYREWIDEGVREKWLHDVGDGLGEGCVVNSMNIVTDGPFAESKEVVGGYQIVNADTLEAAVELAKRCPNLLVGGSVEVRPLAGHAERY
jgi:hypothetical protein